MAVQPLGKFKFNFADLAPQVEPRRLQVLDSAPTEAPPQAAPLPAPAQPRWLPRLLPIFSAAAPMRVQVAGEASPPFAARLRRGLAAIYAAAGAEAGVRVLVWADGFAVGGHALDRLPSVPHALVVAAELEPGSLAAAALRLRALPAERRWLVLHGNLPRLDAALGLPEIVSGLEPHRLIRLPLLGRSELAAQGRGVEPAMARRRPGRRLLGLAVVLARSYLELTG